MRRSVVTVSLVAIAATVAVALDAAPARKPLGPKEREALLAVIKAVDRAQETDAVADSGVGWSSHVLKGGNQSAYVPFRVTLAGVNLASPVLYVRAVSRRDGYRVSEEHSVLRDWVLRGGDVAPRMPETVSVVAAEMPFGTATMSSRQATAAAAAASGALELQQRAYEKQKAAAEAAKKKEEGKERDQFLFPFEDFYLLDLKPGATIERALALAPGEYDVFVALIDRGKVKTSTALVARRTVTVPDYWADQLALSTIILARDVKTLQAPLAAPQQVERPYAIGYAEILPVDPPAFTQADALTIVYQVLNYGAPDADLLADYAFYRVDGGRRLFNRTNSQAFGDDDLPKAGPWETAAFLTQRLPLAPFPPGEYELEVQVRDRLTRSTAKSTVAFTVSSGVR